MYPRCWLHRAAMEMFVYVYSDRVSSSIVSISESHIPVRLQITHGYSVAWRIIHRMADFVNVTRYEKIDAILTDTSQKWNSMIVDRFIFWYRTALLCRSGFFFFVLLKVRSTMSQNICLGRKNILLNMVKKKMNAAENYYRNF